MKTIWGISLIIIALSFMIVLPASAIPQSWNLQCTGHEGHVKLHADKSADATFDGKSYSFMWTFDEVTGDGQGQWLFWSEPFHYDGHVVTSDFISGCPLVPDTNTIVQEQTQESWFGIFGFSS